MDEKALEMIKHNREIDATNIRNIKGALIHKIGAIQADLVHVKKRLEQCKDNPTVSGIGSTGAAYTNDLKIDMAGLYRQVTNYRAYNFVDKLTDESNDKESHDT